MYVPKTQINSAILIMLLYSSPAFSQDTVTCPVRVDVPSVVRITGTDNVTSTQNLTIDQSSISFDSSLTATGEASVVWKGNTNSNNGFSVTVQRSAITGTGSTELQSDITVYGQNSPGGDNDAVMLGTYATGKSLTSVSDSIAEPFCQSNKAGSAMFKVGLKLNSPSAHGKGNVNTVLTFVAAAL
ncbi:MAG: hypothetical protein K2X81_13990 [Candidatus Obscuribacterales bacterium]|nr:hypothetical protein [Candidatus Obscuribacterales bacterium]